MSQASPSSRTYQTNSGVSRTPTTRRAQRDRRHRHAGHGGALAAGLHRLLENDIDEDEEGEHLARDVFRDPLEVIVALGRDLLSSAPPRPCGSISSSPAKARSSPARFGTRTRRLMIPPPCRVRPGTLGRTRVGQTAHRKSCGCGGNRRWKNPWTSGAPAGKSGLRETVLGVLRGRIAAVGVRAVTTTGATAGAEPCRTPA